MTNLASAFCQARSSREDRDSGTDFSEITKSISGVTFADRQVILMDPRSIRCADYEFVIGFLKFETFHTPYKPLLATNVLSSECK